MSIISSGIVSISSGVTSTGLEVIQNGIVQVLNGGWAEVISAKDGGSVVVSKGGILYQCVLTGGTATVLNDGWVEAVSVENGRLFLLNSDASTHDTRIFGGGSARIGRDVMATGVTILDGGVLHVDPAGYARAPIVSSVGAKKNDRQRRRDYDRRQRRHGETHHGQFRWRAPGFTGGTAVEITENGGYVEVADGAAEFADAISRLNRKVC